MASTLPPEMETSSSEIFDESSLETDTSFLTPLTDRVTERRRKHIGVFESMLENVKEEDSSWSQSQNEVEKTNESLIIETTERTPKGHRSSAPGLHQSSRSPQASPDVLTRLSSPLAPLRERNVTPNRWRFSKMQKVIVNSEPVKMRRDSVYDRYVQADKEPWLSYMATMLRRDFNFRPTWASTWYDLMMFALSKVMLYSFFLLLLTVLVVSLYFSIMEHSNSDTKDKRDEENSLMSPQVKTPNTQLFPIIQEISYSYDLILTLDHQQEQIRAFNSCCIQNVECLQKNEVFEEEITNLRRHCSQKLAVKENLIRKVTRYIKEYKEDHFFVSKQTCYLFAFIVGILGLFLVVLPMYKFETP